jgi:hypothetical protein
MSEMTDKVARAIFEVSSPYVDHCCAKPDFDKCPCAEDARHQARVAIGAIRDILVNSQNSSLAYTGDELDAELKEDA